jgi:P-type Ca2+ transporter type 2C
MFAAGGWVKSAAPSLTPYELSVFFTAFVLLQFWNLFRVRTLRGTWSLKGCGVFCAIAGVILFGQIILVTFGGRLFDVVALSVADWGILLGVTLVPLLFASIKVPTSIRGKNMV